MNPYKKLFIAFLLTIFVTVLITIAILFITGDKPKFIDESEKKIYIQAGVVKDSIEYFEDIKDVEMGKVRVYWGSENGRGKEVDVLVDGKYIYYDKGLDRSHFSAGDTIYFYTIQCTEVAAQGNAGSPINSILVGIYMTESTAKILTGKNGIIQR